MSEPDRTGRERGCRNDAAPYLLGALDSAEARAFAHHMRSCAACRDEVAVLAPVLDVLPSCVPRQEVGAALRRRVMHAVRSEPKVTSGAARRLRRPPRLSWPALRASPLRRPAVPAVAAALALALTLVVVIAAGSLGSHESPARVIRASVGQAHLQVADGRGELIVDHLPPAPADRVYELWLQRGNRPPTPSTLFEVTSRGTAVLGVPGAVTGTTRVLVTVEPAGGSRVPTTRAVIFARV
jgi:anti-sigma-K factor RskA